MQSIPKRIVETFKKTGEKFSEPAITQDDKLYGKAGVLILSGELDMINIVESVNNLLDYTRNRVIDKDFNEVHTVIHQDFTTPLESWIDSVSVERLELLKEFNRENLDEKHRSKIDNPLIPNGMVYNLFFKLKKWYNIIEGTDEYELIKGWKVLIGIEAITNNSADRYKSNNFSYFGGSVKEEDNTILDTAKRELLEESRIKLDEFIWTDEYQSKMRKKHNLPLRKNYIDLNYIKYYSRIYLIFMENINTYEISNSNSSPSNYLEIKLQN